MQTALHHSSRHLGSLLFNAGPCLPVADACDADERPVVFVVEEDVVVRQSLERLLHAQGWRSETFPSAPALLSRTRPAVPCCLVLGATLPGLSGFVVQAMAAGAVEFLTKPYSDVALLEAIAGAVEQSRIALGQDGKARELRQCFASLTRRERQVMTLVVSGLLNKQVGGELGISEITVKAHRGRMMRKMRAQSLPHLVTIAATLSRKNDGSEMTGDGERLLGPP